MAAKSSPGRLQSLDPRARVASALLLAAAAGVAVSPVLLVGLAGAGLGLCTAGGLPFRRTLRRMAVLNAAGLALALLLAIDRGHDALAPACVLLLRINAAGAAPTALLDELDPLELGRALAWLRVPARLAHLVAFGARYAELIDRERQRVQWAARARGFVPRLDAHTLRTLGYMAGGLLVRAFDRAERVAWALRCRGYTGSAPQHASAPLRTGGRLLIAAAAGAAAAGAAWGRL